MRPATRSIRGLRSPRALAACISLVVACCLLAGCATYHRIRLDYRVAQLDKEGRYAEAIPVAEELLALTEEEFPPDHTQVARILNNVAGLYYATGDYEHAATLVERSLAIWEEALGPDHPDDQYTAIDDATRIRALKVYRRHTQQNAIGNDYNEVSRACPPRSCISQSRITWSDSVSDSCDKPRGQGSSAARHTPTEG